MSLSSRLGVVKVDMLLHKLTTKDAEERLKLSSYSWKANPGFSNQGKRSDDDAMAHIVN